MLHWPAGSGGRGALLTGDTITVVQDREWVSFMWSYPNLIPLDEATVARDRRAGSSGSPSTGSTAAGGAASCVADGAGAVRRSADRYLARLHGERPPSSPPA